MKLLPERTSMEESAPPPSTQHSEAESPAKPPKKLPSDDEKLGDIQQDDDPEFPYGEFVRFDDTTTLHSSIMKYREENGRTYHAYGTTEYWGPNDEQAKDQQDLSHHFWTLCLEDKFFIAPIDNPKKILDLGTGTGIWVMDVAERYPDADVKGIDLSPIQPSWVPPNVTFEVDDFNLDWENDDRYDLIHMRELLGSVKDWVQLYKKCLKALNRGGWVDICEPYIFPDSQFVKLEPDHPYYKWAELFKAIGAKSGMRFDIAEDIKGWLEEAGFVNIIERKIPVAIGTWPKDKKQKTLGLWNQARVDAGMRDFGERRMRNTMKWEEDEISILISKMRACVKNNKLCANMRVHFLCAQKPG